MVNRLLRALFLPAAFIDVRRAPNAVMFLASFADVSPRGDIATHDGRSPDRDAGAKRPDMRVPVRSDVRWYMSALAVGAVAGACAVDEFEPSGVGPEVVNSCDNDLDCQTAGPNTGLCLGGICVAPSGDIAAAFVEIIPPTVAAYGANDTESVSTSLPRKGPSPIVHEPPTRTLHRGTQPGHARLSPWREGDLDDSHRLRGTR